MTKIKKIIAIIISGVLLFSFTSSAFALNRDNTNNLDINYFKDSDKLDTQILDIAERLIELKRNGYTDEQLKGFYNNKLSKQRYDLNGYIKGKLNRLEQQLYNKDPVKGLMCMGNGKFAINYAEQNYHSYSLHNSNGDAFRHVLWNYGMVVDVGYDFAKKWSDAHEYGSNSPQIEKTMDLYNNSIGLELGRNNPNTVWHSTFINKSKDKVKNRSCKIIISGRLVWSNSYGEK